MTHDEVVEALGAQFQHRSGGDITWFADFRLDPIPVVAVCRRLGCWPGYSKVNLRTPAHFPLGALLDLMEKIARDSAKPLPEVGG